MKRTIAIIAACLMFPLIAQAAISGAVTSKAGELAIINSDREAAWSVSPSTYATSYAVSKDGMTVYFASSIPGKVTFFAASVVDGTPCLESYNFYNGVKIDDNNPNPAPVPNNDTIEGVVRAKGAGKDSAELTALADTFAAVVDGIDRGVVTTPTGARETFRAVWIDKGTAANVKALTDLAELIEAISNNVDNTSLETLKKGYSEAAEALRLIIPAKAKTPVKTQNRAQNWGGCSNGQCYRWGW